MKPPKWHLLSRVMPVMAVVLALKVIAHAVDWEPIAPNALLSGLIAATVFVLGVLLSATLADFKEGERLVGDVAAAIDSLADELRILHTGGAAGEARDGIREIRRITVAARMWLAGSGGSTHDTVAMVSDLNEILARLEPLVQAPFIVRLKQEQAVLRRSLIRIGTVAERSSFIAGYAIAEVLSAMLIGALLLVEVDPFAADVFFITAISFLVTYVLALVRDLDQPFQLGGRRGGKSKVSLEPFESLEERLDRLLLQTRP